jgi:hypothetical protein
MYTNNNSGIMRQAALQETVKWYQNINDYMKAFGIIIGGLFASLADWLLGTFTLSILFSNAPFLLVPAWVIGLIWSGASWGVQLILWQMVLSGKITQLLPGKGQRNLAFAGLFLLIVLAKLGDDGIDMTSIYWLSQNNPFIAMLNPAIYKILFACVAVVSWILVGFSEAFVALSMMMLGGMARGSYQPLRPHTQPSQPTPSVSPRPKPRNAPVPLGQYQELNRHPSEPLYNEPTYHSAYGSETNSRKLSGE